ncbi:hypothetical protein ACO0K9_26945 [Undibacterium sp. Ji50W]
MDNKKHGRKCSFGNLSVKAARPTEKNRGKVYDVRMIQVNSEAGRKGF